MIQNNERTMTRCTYCCHVDVLSTPQGLHTNKSTFSVCLMNQVSRQTISRISQSDSQLRLRRAVRQSVNSLVSASHNNQSIMSQSVCSIRSSQSHWSVSQYIAVSLPHQSVRLSNYPSVRLYHSNLPFSRHSLITSHSLESCHSVASKYCAVCCCCLRSTVCEFRLFIQSSYVPHNTIPNLHRYTC